MRSLVRSVFFVRHRAHLWVNMLASPILAEITHDYSISFVQARQYLDPIGALDSRVNFALLYMVLRIDQKDRGFVRVAVDRLQGKGKGVGIVLNSQGNVGVHSRGQLVVA